MACLALSLQPINGPDILLQTREWFPPARALIASSKFREKRSSSSSSPSPSSEVSIAMAEGLGDDALAASGGQVIVGKESKFRVFYRLVNTIYVLGIASVEQQGEEMHANAFQCAGIVNQAVTVLVAVCKGVDVTPDKLLRKYTEIYLALDMVLRGVGATRLASILASIQGEGVPHMVLSAIDAENRARGSDSWNVVKGQATEHLANIDVLSLATFELPEETIAAGDEVVATITTTTQTSGSGTQMVIEEKKKTPESGDEDPFAMSDKINRPEELAGGFKKSKEPSDLTLALADIEVPKPTANIASSLAGVEGFEGDYGGLDFEEENIAFGGAFEGEDGPFGGGLDAISFGAVVETPLEKGLGGLEELQIGGKSVPKVADEAKKPDSSAQELVLDDKLGKPMLYLSEEVFAEFKGSKLRRIGLQGTLYVDYHGTQDTSFAFRLDGGAGIRRAILRNSSASSLGKNLFHVRTSAVKEPLPIMRYRLHPRYTPLPIRVRLLTRQSGSLMSFMIQYIANPFLPAPLKGVTFIVSLSYVPSLLKMSPKGTLHRHSKEIRWLIEEVPLQGPPGCLRAQMPLELEDENGDKKTGDRKIRLDARVEFSDKGKTLSGLSLLPGTEGNADFSVGIHSFKAADYSCS